MSWERLVYLSVLFSSSTRDLSPQRDPFRCPGMRPLRRRCSRLATAAPTPAASAGAAAAAARGTSCARLSTRGVKEAPSPSRSPAAAGYRYARVSGPRPGGESGTRATILAPLLDPCVRPVPKSPPSAPYCSNAWRIVRGGGGGPSVPVGMGVNLAATMRNRRHEHQLIFVLCLDCKISEAGTILRPVSVQRGPGP